MTFWMSGRMGLMKHYRKHFFVRFDSFYFQEFRSLSVENFLELSVNSLIPRCISVI